jgi:hypothetical protein
MAKRKARNQVIIHLGVSGQNDIWVLVLWPSTEYNIMGKVAASPKFGPWWVLWVRVCPWLVCAPKCSNYTLTNLLFGLCKSTWVIDLLVNLPSPHPKLQHAPLPSKCCEPKSTPQLFFPFFAFTFGLAVESIKELRGSSHLPIKKKGFSLLHIIVEVCKILHNLNN